MTENEEYESAVAACPTPAFHETHRYCPSCPWAEERSPTCAIRDCDRLVTVEVTLRSRDGDEHLDFCERHLSLRYTTWDRMLPEPLTSEGRL